MVGQVDNQIAFYVNVSFRSLKYYCITGTVGVLYVLMTCLIFSERPDAIFYIKLSCWFLFGSANVAMRWYLYLAQPWTQNSKYADLSKRATSIAAGILWGSAGLLFISELSHMGQLTLIVVLVAQTFNGIPAYILSPTTFIHVYLMIWVPTIVLMRNDPILIYIVVISLVSLLSSVFICFTLRAVIDELFLLKESSNEKVDELDKDNQQLRMFLLAANHDLSQPISAIQHSLFLLKKNVMESEPVSNAIKTIDTCTQSLKRLIKEIILSEEIASGIVKAEMVPVNLNEVFSRVGSNLEHLAHAKKIRLLARPTKRVALTDAYILERILGNLVENALKYTVQGSVLLVARPQGECVSIEVWDTGLGMDKDEINQIFKSFYRREATKDMQSGYGLGLAIVKRLADSLGTEITARSTLGRGSVFRIRLPSAVNNQAAESNHPFPASNSEGNTLMGMKVALLDDDELLLQSISDVLKSEGALVTSSTNLRQLSELIAVNPQGYHAIITDWNLQVGTGELAYQELIKMTGPNIAWIVISGNLEEKKEKELLAKGASIIRKPFAPDALIHQLNDIVAESAS
jgi:signal transduction histidine kinase